MAQDITTKDFVLRNHSVVPVSFKMIRQENDCESVFDVTPTEGMVPFQVGREGGTFDGQSILDRCR